MSRLDFLLCLFKGLLLKSADENLLLHIPKHPLPALSYPILLSSLEGLGVSFPLSLNKAWRCSHTEKHLHIYRIEY